jgi:putative transposase
MAPLKGVPEKNMTHTYYEHLYHLVWSTKDRQPLIPNEIKERFYHYLVGAFRTTGCLSIQIGGMPDHIHILASIPPKFAVSEIIRDVKICSTKWVNATLPECKSFAWQEGFGAFTVSPSEAESVIQYILNQEEHHKKVTFREEFIAFLEKFEIHYDEAYLWK